MLPHRAVEFAVSHLQVSRYEHVSSYSGVMAHGSDVILGDRLDAAFAELVADTMQALATASRVRILGQLHAGPRAVGDLAEAVGMEPSAVSHQLRLLRHLGLVVGKRDGRRVLYELHDDHVGQMLEQAISHVEHLRLAVHQPAPAHVDVEVIT
jgi:ArsR family transcriptional regulator, nickel/cobalt-responsive transcriptional repressor